MSQLFSYMHAIGEGFPTVECTCVGDPHVYESIVQTGTEPIPSKSTLDALILTMSRAKIWQSIQDERNRRQNGGVFISSIGKWFHSDQTSRIQQLGLVMMGASLPAGIMWKTMDGSFVEMTQTLAGAIFNGAATLDMMAFAVAEQHRTGMMNSGTPGTYNFSAGWPAIFVG